MGLLNLKSRTTPAVTRLPSGSFTVNRNRKVVTSTLPQSFSPILMQEIADHTLNAFRDAQAAGLSPMELEVHYASLKITAREMRGGAIVFLTPQTFVHTQD